MVHNAVHHAFMITYSPGRDAHPDEYTELGRYITQFGKWFCLKAEDVDGEGKVHLHAIHIREFAQYEERPSRQVTMYGPRRCADTAAHIAANCPTIAATMANHGSKHALRADALTSTQYIEYLNKETHCHVNNLPDDPCLLQPYLSESGPKIIDPEMAADAKKYATCEAEPWFRDPPTAQSCRRFYRYYCNVLKQKRTIKDPKTLQRKAETLAAFINESVYSDGEEDCGRCVQCNRETPSFLHTLCKRCI